MTRKVLLLPALVAALVWAACASDGSAETTPAAPPTGTPQIILFESVSATASPTAEAYVSPEPTAEPLTRSLTTGRKLDGKNVFRPVLAIIANAANTRPQTGLMQADIVYELPMDRTTQITRFLAVFSDTVPACVGPIQSARTYFVSLQQEWGGMFVYWGYPTDSDPSYAPLDQDAVALNASYRDGTAAYYYTDETVTSTTEYSRFVRLSTLSDTFYRGTSAKAVEHFYFEEGIAYSFGKPFAKVGIPFAGSDLKRLEFVYDETDNRLYRYERNSKNYLAACKTRTPSADGKTLTTEPISVQNLIVQYVKFTYPNDQYREAQLIGSGKCEYFVNGRYVTGTWKRAEATDVTRYYLNDGTPLTLEPGNTWIAIQPDNRQTRVRIAE